MKILTLIAAVFLTGCGTNLTVKFSPVDEKLKVPCGETIFSPLTDADPLDLARALGEAKEFGRTCRARHNELIEAVRAREAIAVEIAK